MADKMMACRVCGKAYEPCRTARRSPNVFHWQEVACSPECGAIYFQRIVESRKGAHEEKGNAYVEAEAMEHSSSSATVEAEHAQHSFDMDAEAE